ncbi:nuclear receptor subfamily 1 group D [Elysia marginata]|uniref:Nuclear receptor subfamily 1 group D n=1 Tax=Elysia marginata TaxID=1093978 RepID=A0AAV4H2Y3_9GAST|nr:nuclear receptor subfamily 1 group D [Elysia marginata]
MRAAQMREHALNTQQYVSCPSNMACPLNNELGMESNRGTGGSGGGTGSGGDGGGGGSATSDFSESFTPAIKSVVDFAKGIPGFVLLNQDDQVTLLKAGTFEVLLVRFACLFDPQTNTMMFTGGKLYQRQASSTVSTA